MRDLRGFVRVIYSLDPAQYDLHGIELPTLDPWVYRHLADRAFSTHALGPLEPPSRIVEAEGFVLLPCSGLGCGLSTREWLAVQRRRDPRLASLIVQHERAHGWLKRRGEWDFTEADVWLATGFLALPGRLRVDFLRGGHPYLPDWFCQMPIFALAE